MAISFGLTAWQMHSINCTFDTSTGPNLLREEPVEPDWLLSIRLCDSPWLKRTTIQTVGVIVTIVLYVRVRDSRKCVMFEIIRNVAVPVLLGPLFIDKFIKGIFTSERRIVPSSSPSAPNLTTRDENRQDRWTTRRHHTHHNSWARPYPKIDKSFLYCNT